MRRPLQIDQNISDLYNELNHDYINLALSIEEKVYLYDYSATSFVEVNNTLRANNIYMNSEAYYKVLKIDDIINKTSKKYNFTLFRGHNYPAITRRFSFSNQGPYRQWQS